LPGSSGISFESVSSKGSANSWRVQDAFEDLKTCKLHAEKAVKRNKSPGVEDFELNAGYYLYSSQRDPLHELTRMWLCLPAGTNPMILQRNWVEK
jgi:hypothetical protein